MMSCNTPSIVQTNETIELSFFFSMDIRFYSRLSLTCGAWVFYLFSSFFLKTTKNSENFMLDV